MIRKKQDSSVANQDSEIKSQEKQEDQIKSKEEVKNQDNPNVFSVTFNVKIGDRVIEGDLDKSLHIPTIDKLNPAMISNMMAEIPSLHARWNFFYNEALYEYDMKNTKLDIWLAKKSQEYRKQLAQDGKVTEKMIDETVKSDPEFERFSEELARAKKNMKHILAQANGFGEKGEKLINIASMIKWEGENLIGGNRMSGQKTYGHIKKKSEEYQQDISKNDGWPT